MTLTLDLKDPRISISESYREFGTSLLSQVADNLGNDKVLSIRSYETPLVDIASGLESGTICVYGTLGRKTANGMSGGVLCVRGNVGRISNVFGGLIYVDGDIHRLANIHEDTKLFCTGNIGEHLYGSDEQMPSPYIFCSTAPRNSVSSAIDEYVKLPREYHYLIKVRTISSQSYPDPLTDPQEILPRIFAELIKDS